MVFSSSIFLFGFLPLLLFAYYLVNDRFKNVILLMASLLFYAWGEPKNVFLMILSIVVNYFLAIMIDKFRKYSKILLICSCVYNIGMLFVFKYLGFFAGILQSITGVDLSINEISLPIGISFYTFQILSYVIDVYRNKVPVQRNLLDLGLYVSLFPQLIAGPIVRYSDVARQIKERSTTSDGLYCGIRRFVIGFSKKILIADQLAKIADLAFRGGGHLLQVTGLG